MKSYQRTSKYKINISEEAQSDFRDIMNFSRSNWGEAQALKYRSKIEKGLETILANPNIGRKKDAYFEGCRVFHVGRHLVFYIIKEKTVHVVRMLSEDMDVEKNL